jgi:signal peptidase I
MTMSTFRTVAQPLAIAIALAFVVRTSSIGFYSIPSSSMEPTLRPGDTVVVTPYVAGSRPVRGDVVVFRSPSNNGEMVVKRIVAEAGDLVESRDGKVFVRGHALAEPYASGSTAAIAPQIIPGNSFYVLGDNRTNSYDSRLWGSIAGTAIVGRARLILWSGSIAPPASASARTPSVESAPGVRLFRVVR